MPLPARTDARRAVVGLLAVGLLGPSCSSDEASAPDVLVAFDDARPGDTVGLIAVDNDDGTRTVEWADRVEGTIHRLDIDDEAAAIESVATIDVGTDGEQRGLLGQVMIDGRRYASWTTPEDFELVVGEVDGNERRVIWSAGESGSGAIGGVVDSGADGSLLIGLGRNTGWDRDSGVGGAIIELDPDADADQTETAISIGYTNPWAFRSTTGDAVWVADNAAGPDPDDETRDDIERIGRADVEPDRNEMNEIDGSGRAPAAMVELPDGRIGICGFLDNELRAYDTSDTDLGPSTGLEPAETIMPCNTGAAVFDDGTIVTAAQTESGESLLILRP